MIAEIWRDVGDGWPYEVSSHGRVRRTTSKTFGKAGAVIKPTASKKGYLRVGLNKNNQKKTVFIAPLVCRIFHGPKPTPKHHAAHHNGNKQDNSDQNLSWKTQSENEIDKRAHGKAPRGENNPGAKLSQADVDAIRILLAEASMPQTKIAKKFRVSSSCISQIKFGHTWVTTTEGDQG